MPENRSHFDDDYLFKTKHGSVLRCSCCGRYEVSFRQNYVQLEQLYFAHLVNSVRSLPVSSWEEGSFGVLCLTPSDAPVAVRLILNRNDVLELRDLLDGAAAMDELGGLLEETLGSPLA